jgi:hypothetical protein
MRTAQIISHDALRDSLGPRACRQRLGKGYVLMVAAVLYEKSGMLEVVSWFASFPPVPLLFLCIEAV